MYMYAFPPTAFDHLQEQEAHASRICQTPYNPGIQERNVTCVVRSGDDFELADASHCSEPAPVQQRNCNSEQLCPEAQLSLVAPEPNDVVLAGSRMQVCCSPLLF